MHRHIHIAPDRRIKLVQGSHIIVPRLYAGEYAYLLQHIDKRVVFVIPYQEKFSLIGTTDVAYTGDPGAVHITTAEINYLCAAINRYFKKNIKPEDIVSSYSGVRALFSEESENLSGLSRDYKIERLDQEDAPLINIFGGKITTYRRLAEAVMELLKPSFKQLPPAWTDSVPLPGGDIPQGDILLFARQLQQEYTWLPDKLCQRYANQYGAYCRKFLKSCHALSDLGYCFGDSLYQAEVDYLLVHEWAQTAEDVLWRRSKSGLWFDATAIQTLQNYLAERYVELQAG